ncbi:MAG TPA: dolichyl-phosphate beta-glucosyltransferase [bacterium]|nr:dolichyl-phosphate beta-glucosyltransferase [bacterium]
MRRFDLSVIIPVFNEQARVGKTLEDSLAYLRRSKLRAEILVVDDGSKDKTVQTVEKAGKKVKGAVALRVLAQGINRGKGAAVRMGALEAQGDVVLFMDADNATPLSEYEKFRPWFKRGIPVVIGSRAVDRSQVKVPQPLYRQVLGRAANLVIQVLVVWGIWDTQCGFKAFTREAAKVIFPRQTIERFGFDFELLFLAHKLGFPIQEVPVQWFNSPYSKVRLGDYFGTLVELLSIRWKDLKGVYERPVTKTRVRS